MPFSLAFFRKTPAQRGFFLAGPPSKNGLGIATAFFSACIQATPLSDRLEQLANLPAWLALLHFENGSPTFVSDEFYLSNSRAPLDELKALIEQADTSVEDERLHPRCRFPARYAWLGKKLNRPEWTRPPRACRKLHIWLDRHRLTGASIILVSGYMGNPASLFGHNFIKLYTADQNADLWQTSLSYGAQVPQNEDVLHYIYRGLTGGYTANFTDRYFYNQDLAYTRTEARDMWEYPLHLSPQALYALQLHIWEVTNRHKRYYFLTHNCAYELGRLLEGALGRPKMQPAKLWYLPEELVEQARQFGLVEESVYHPAAERRLIWQYRLLPQSLRSRADRFMQRQVALDETLSGLDGNRQQQLLNFLLTYQHFLTMQQMPNLSAETQNLRHQLLMARLRLPPSDIAPPEPPNRPSPLDGERASTIWTGVYRSKTLRGSIGASPYTRPPEGHNILDGDELTLLWIEASFNDNEIRLEQLDYIRILHHALSPLPNASPWSWRLLLRTERLPTGQYDHQAHFGAGRSLALGQSVMYGLLTPALHSAAPELRLKAEAGVITRLSSTTRLHIATGMENDHGAATNLATIKLHKLVSGHIAWSLEGQWDSNKDDAELNFRLQWRF